MEVIITKNEKVLDVKVIGSITSDTYNELDSKIAEYIDEVNRINIDFEQVDYMSSAGLRILLSLHKKLMSLGGLHIYKPNSIVMEVFTITGFKDILFIEE